MRGRSILAEEEASARATQSIVIRLDPPWSNVTVVKKLATLKLYHDWDWCKLPVGSALSATPHSTSLSCRLQGLHWLLGLLL